MNINKSKEHSYKPLNSSIDSDLRDVSFHVEVPKFIYSINIISTLVGIGLLSLPYIFILTGIYYTIILMSFVVFLILRGIYYMDILAYEYNINGPKMSLLYKRIIGNWSRYTIDIFTAIS